jgi:hypothetical protein
MRVRKRFWRIGLLVVLAAALAGCGGESGGKVKSYGNDGYLGLTNANPKIPARTGTTLNYRHDTELMESVLRQIPEVQKIRITLNGPTAHIRITLPAGTTEAEKNRIESQAREAVAFNLPRYRIDLKARVAE